MSSFNEILIYSLLAGFGSFAGILIMHYYSKWIRINTTYLISFSAGVLLSAAFLRLIPDSMILYSGSIDAVLVGFIAFYLVESAIMVHSCQEADCKEHRFGTVSLIGLGLHSFIDGFAIGVGFEVSQLAGIITTLGVLLHKLPEGITTMSLMLCSGMGSSKSFRMSSIVSAATPLGAAVSYFLITKLNQSSLGILLSVVAGFFIYIAASDLIPETHQKFNKNNIIFFMAGIVLLYGVGLVFI